MKAIVYHQYGGPENLNLEEIEKPVPKDTEVLVKVHAASLNPLDWHFMRGTPYMVRMMTGLFKPKQKVLGVDIAGTVEGVGSKITQFKPGDQVFGGTRSGGFAEYTCAAEDRLTLIPSGISFCEAAASPVAGLTALQGLRDFGQISYGQKVLINGASGGVGTYAVQIAKYFGAEVTAVCSTRNQDMVRSIGADHLLDYTLEDFTKTGEQYDLIFEGVGNKSVKDLKPTLCPGGIAVMIGFTTNSQMVKFMLQAPFVKRNSDKKMGSITAKMNQPDLTSLAQLLESKKVNSIIDRTYAISEFKEAMIYQEAGHTQGKVVFEI